MALEQRTFSQSVILKKVQKITYAKGDCSSEVQRHDQMRSVYQALVYRAIRFQSSKSHQ